MTVSRFPRHISVEHNAKHPYSFNLVFILCVVPFLVAREISGYLTLGETETLIKAYVATELRQPWDLISSHLILLTGMVVEET